MTISLQFTDLQIHLGLFKNSIFFINTFHLHYISHSNIFTIIFLNYLYKTLQCFYILSVLLQPLFCKL